MNGTQFSKAQLIFFKKSCTASQLSQSFVGTFHGLVCQYGLRQFIGVLLRYFFGCGS